MSQFNSSIHAVLVPASDLPGVWCSWCPQLDIVSQGDNPEHAIGMLIDAIRMASEWDLTSFTWESASPGDPLRGELVRTPKRVRHPMRRGSTSSQDEDLWPEFVRYRDMSGEWRRNSDMEVARLTPDIGFSVVHGDLSITCRGGIVHCQVSFSNHAIVPGRNFDVRVRVMREIDLIVSLPTSVLSDESVLRRAGMEAETIVRLEAQLRADEMGGEVLSITERPLVERPA